MRTIMAVFILVAVVGCATPRQRAEDECRREVAAEMGYTVRADGTWRALPGTSPSNPGAPIPGAAAAQEKIRACVRARGA